jgi:hypothetical protein
MCISCIICADKVSNMQNCQFVSYTPTMAILWRPETYSEKISIWYTKIVAMDGSSLLPFELHNLIVNYLIIYSTYCFFCPSKWPCSLTRTTVAARLMRLWVRIPPGKWRCVGCDCCVLSGRGLYDELITRPGFLLLCSRHTLIFFVVVFS